MSFSLAKVKRFAGESAGLIGVPCEGLIGSVVVKIRNRIQPEQLDSVISLLLFW